MGAPLPRNRLGKQLGSSLVRCSAARYCGAVQALNRARAMPPPRGAGPSGARSRCALARPFSGAILSAHGVLSRTFAMTDCFIHRSLLHPPQCRASTRWAPPHLDPHWIWPRWRHRRRPNIRRQHIRVAPTRAATMRAGPSSNCRRPNREPHHFTAVFWRRPKAKPSLRALYRRPNCRSLADPPISAALRVILLGNARLG